MFYGFPKILLPGHNSKKLAGLQMSFLTLRQANRLQNTHTRHKINGVKLDNLIRRLGTAKN